MKKRALAVIMLLVFPAGLVLAADQTSAANSPSDLQQQLQSIQQSMNRPTSSAQLPANAINTIPGGPSPTSGAAANVQIPIIPTPGQVAAPPITSMSAAATTQQPPASQIDLRDEAFLKVTNTLLPLSPSQIQMLRNVYDATQRAAAVFPGVPPRPTSTSISVNLSPGAVPPVIRLGAGFVTSMVFVDSTGAPWPIESYSLGNPQAFNIVWDKKSNILLAQAITTHRVGNLAVLLRGLNTPVMIDLNPGQAAMDVRVDLRIPGLGPEAKPIFSGLPGEQSPYLLALLDGIPPAGARELKATGCDNCVWLVKGKLYLRTPYTVISPAWISTLSSADGTHVYEMQPTPLVLATYNGKTIKLKIEGF